jgi:hypothetical protein
MGSGSNRVDRGTPRGVREILLNTLPSADSITRKLSTETENQPEQTNDSAEAQEDIARTGMMLSKLVTFTDPSRLSARTSDWPSPVRLMVTPKMGITWVYQKNRSDFLRLYIAYESAPKLDLHRVGIEPTTQ